MEKILNSIEELYQLITGTLPEGYVEYRTKDIHNALVDTKIRGMYVNTATYYFVITDGLFNDRFKKVEYGKKYKPIITDGRIYKYV